MHFLISGSSILLKVAKSFDVDARGNKTVWKKKKKLKTANREKESVLSMLATL